MTPQQWKEVIDTNLSGVFNMTHPRVGRHARPQVRPRHHHLLDQRPEGPDGAGELFGRQGRRHRLHQGAGAGGRAGGHHRQRDLPRLHRHRDGQGRAEKVLEAIVPQIPVGRLGEPEEIARCVVFLASDEAGFITGSTLRPMAASIWRSLPNGRARHDDRPLRRPDLFAFADCGFRSLSHDGTNPLTPQSSGEPKRAFALLPRSAAGTMQHNILR